MRKRHPIIFGIFVIALAILSSIGVAVTARYLKATEFQQGWFACAMLSYVVLCFYRNEKSLKAEQAKPEYEFTTWEGNSIMAETYMPKYQKAGWELAGESAAKFSREGDEPRLCIPLKRIKKPA